MIDASKCIYEEGFYEPDFSAHVYYFTYPKSMDEVEFEPESEYGNVLCMCISLTVYDNGEYSMMMSPTIEECDGFLDVDWRDLIEGVNYTSSTIVELLAKTKNRNMG